MTVGKSLVLFIGLTAAGFVYICNAIPQIQTEAAAAETTIGGTPEQLRAAGKKIFTSDRAQCLTCHSLTEDPKARCPNQDGLGERAPRRRPGMSAAEYLVESVYNPNAFVVSGYPKNQMQPVNKPPIALSHDQILAVIVFLNSLGGTTDASFVEQVRKVQDPWRRGLLKPEAGPAKFRPPIYAGDAERGGKIFAEQGCNTCHKIGNEGREVCPDLTAIGSSQTPDYILESILQPNAVIVKGYNELTVAWKAPGRFPIRGRPMKWIPDKERPRALLLNVDEEGKRVDVRIDLADVTAVGDTVVEVVPEGGSEDDELVLHFGEYVSGDKESGIVLKVLLGNTWAERRIPPEGIDAIGYPTSPMPGDYAQRLTPRQIYDLVAFLTEQKGRPRR